MTFVTRYNARVFEPFFRFPIFQEEAQAATWNPPVDVHEEKDRIFVKVEVPGVDENNLKVTYEDGLLTITGERQFERRDDRNYHRIERSYGSFTRTFSLPRTVDPNQIVADYRNGILEIAIPKREDAKPRQISVNIGSQKSIEA